MKPAFNYFGCKQRIAEQVWQRLGDPTYFYEPFVGAGGVFLARSTAPKYEFIGDSYWFGPNCLKLEKERP